MKEQLKCGIYRHYTGLMVLILGVARHSETEERFVVYVPLGAKKGPRLTIRPLKMFLEGVEIDGQKQPRFEYIDTEMPADLALNYRTTIDWGKPEKESV